MRFVAITVVILGAALLAAPIVVHALPEMAISPAVVDVRAAPGQAITTEITVANPGSVAYTVSVFAWDMWHDGKERRYAPPGTFPHSLAQRVAASPASFSLAAGAKQPVQVTIDVPVDAQGGQYAVLFFEMSTDAPEAARTGQGPVLTIAGRIGASLIVDTDIAGAIVKVGKVEDVAIQPPTASMPLRIATKILNETQTHLRPFATAVILKDRAPVGRFTLPSVLLLPGQRGVLEGEWTGTLGPGDYTLLLTVVSSDGQGETLQRRFHVD